MPRFRSMVPLLLAVAGAAVALAVPLAPAAETAPPPRALLQSDPALAEKLAAVRDAHKVPGLWAALIEGEELVAAAAVGVRKVGADEPATPNDLLHIGSDTKAMTATLIARLVERKKLGWGSTVGGVLPGAKGQVHDDYLGVTVTQLLAHEGGVVPNVVWWAVPADKTARGQRTGLIPVILKGPPKDPPGTKFVYSNAGYVIAGAMAEAAADAPWEELIREHVFQPLDMRRAGFGPPGRADAVDQPWGHRPAKDGYEPTRLDNPPVLGPAGTVHVCLADWAKFASAHLLGAQGKGSLLRPETFTKLHAPRDGFRYAGGWGVGQDGSLGHDGSNGSWYTRVRVRPRANVAVLVGANAGGDEAQKAVDAAEKVLAELARARAGRE